MKVAVPPSVAVASPIDNSLSSFLIVPAANSCFPPSGSSAPADEKNRSTTVSSISEAVSPSAFTVTVCSVAPAAKVRVPADRVS